MYFLINSSFLKHYFTLRLRCCTISNISDKDYFYRANFLTYRMFHSQLSLGLIKASNTKIHTYSALNLSIEEIFHMVENQGETAE